jgi:peptidyl-tRNA hydrolase, PTH1 family
VKLLIGIGNPGPSYAQTRHNVGWAVLDALYGSREVSHKSAWKRSTGSYVRARIAEGDTDYALVKPLTFVNLSGDAVVRACDELDAEPGDLLIVVDDVHLPIGQIRLRIGGSSGGHNGTSSIIDALGTDHIPRLRIGIGAPARYGSLVEHVLSSFTPDEIPILDEAVDQCACIAAAFGRGGFTEASAELSRCKQSSAEPGDAP